jgi:hypothetical protein
MKPCALALAITVFGLLAPSAAATTTKVAANGHHLTTREVTQGRFFVRTPDAWQREGRDGLRTATFLVRPMHGCTVKVLVALRGVATRNGPRTQVGFATRAGTTVFGEGDGRAGPFRVVLMNDDTLYAIASKRIANRRYGQVRALGFANGNCTSAALRQIGAHLVKLIRTAPVDVKVRRT